MNHFRPAGSSGRLRFIALPLIILGLGMHLWLGSMIGLAAAGFGLAAHLMVAGVGDRWIRRRRSG
ncbi:hypothetical protein AB0M45_31300 [Nocardia sp. NPDC051787]|uniref:hypothetical protein n=1 Tax=Nocardia sp. NPDC051787 TaxID=3155415 RepID=UPI00342EC965